MEGVLQEFVQVMGKENQTLDAMVALGEQKQRAIISGKVAELDSLIQKESLLVSHLERLENQRYQLQQQLSAHGSGADELVEWTGREYPLLKEEFEEAINRLGFNLARLKVINNHNNELIEQSLQYIETIQAILNGDIAGTYSDKGRPVDEKKGHRVNLLDTRA